VLLFSLPLFLELLGKLLDDSWGVGECVGVLASSVLLVLVCPTPDLAAAMCPAEAELGNIVL
jgi:hypothetical protein